jgi:DNA end-binding protein Ku
VHVYSTGESAASVSFNMVHKDCGTKLKQYYKCPKHDVTVERADTVKGYEFAKNQFVIFTPEELKALEEKGSGSIDINEFIPLAEVEPDLPGKGLLPGPGQGWRPPLPAPRRGAQEEWPGRAGAVRRPRPPESGAGAADQGRRAGDGAAPLRR